MHDVATRCEFPDLTGPLREPSSWLAWLAEVFRPVPDRFDHLHAVWQRAVELCHHGGVCLGAGTWDRLELAALLHDVGRGLDRTTSATGEPVSITQRRHDISRRCGDDSLQVRNFDATLPEVRRAQHLLGLHAL